MNNSLDKYFQRCASTEPWQEIKVQSQSQEDVEYSVIIPYTDDSIDDYICECKGYLHRGYCSHQQIAFEQRCGWVESENSEQQSPEQIENFECPRCFERTILDKK